MGNFELTKMAVNMFCPGNVVQMDDAGLPSILVYIPAFKLSDVLTGADDSTHPAFIVNGKEIPGFYYSKYQNVVHNGKAYSLPAEAPAENITFINALEYCESKGFGWHLCTNAEWAAIALWCKKNGFLPYGNNNYSKDSRENNSKAISASVDSQGRTNLVATGTGPLTWSHDGTPSGIWDLNGNIWEWQGGIRIVHGELQILANNDAADPDNPQNETSTCWKAIKAADGSLVGPECQPSNAAAPLSGNTVRLDFVNEAWTYSTNVTSKIDDTRICNYGDMTCTAAISDNAKGLLRMLALLPEEGATASDYEYDKVYVNNGGTEKYMTRGGVWYMTAQTGVFHFNLACTKTAVASVYGARAAYIPNI